ncbi:MAG TPA: (2Fe-2S)-binding protein [Candidatus Limnocylindria bacterium]|nr:(2Fe-2S)-binding protein [Candidatus Limnocylindria bacterium]
MSEPVWERLRAPDHRRLRIGPIRRASVEQLRIVDGQLPEHDDAVAFDAHHEPDGRIRVRAAARDDIDVTPWEIVADRLDIDGSDGRLEALLAGEGRVAAPGELDRQACNCRGVSVDAAYHTIAAGWETADAVKRATRIGFGPCQGRRCIPWLADRLELDPEDRLAQITPRPPLVPVPISVLRAFVEPDGTRTPD